MNKTLAICDRCRMTFKRYDLMKDPNALGLRVCKNCKDEFNPYRLPPRKMDKIALPWIRPMVHLVAPIYVISSKMPIAPAQDALDPITIETGQGIEATGNIPTPYSSYDLPNIIQEERLPPRLKDRKDE